MKLKVIGESSAMRRSSDERLEERRIHAFCVGAAKTGTSSIAEMFGKHYRSAHEPNSYHYHLTWGGKEVLDGEPGVEEYFLQRDRYFNLEMEASHYLLPALPVLVRLFPDSMFVLTVRDCVSWMISMISEELYTRENRGTNIWWQPWFRQVCGPAEGHPKEERALADAGLSTVRGYMRYWARHNREVLEVVPEPRLLVVRLDELDGSQKQLGGFLKISPDSLLQQDVHANTRVKKMITLDDIGAEYVKAIAREECGSQMEQFFPEVSLS